MTYSLHVCRLLAKNEQVSSLEGRVAQLQSQNHVLDDKLEALTAELNSHVTQLEEELAHKDEKLKEAYSNISILATRSDEAESGKITELQRKLSSAETARIESQKAAVRATEEKGHFEMLLRQAQEEKETAHSAANHLRIRLLTLEEQLVEFNRSSANLVRRETFRKVVDL